jgi:hypothetical protein
MLSVDFGVVIKDLPNVIDTYQFKPSKLIKFKKEADQSYRPRSTLIQSHCFYLINLIVEYAAVTSKG